MMILGRLVLLVRPQRLAIGKEFASTLTNELPTAVVSMFPFR